MRLRKLLATMTMVALLGSDLVLGVSPALAQTSTPGNGNGYQMTPGLGQSDGAYGRVLPGPGTTAPYIGVPPQPQMQQSPQMIQRPAGPAGPNIYQTGVGSRPLQNLPSSPPRPSGP